MANRLLDAIGAARSSGRPLVWLDAEEFGNRVVLGGRPPPWNSPTDFVSRYGQLQSLLQAEVAPIQLGHFLQAWLAANPGALAEMGGKKRVRFAIKRLLGMEEQRQLIREIVSALCETRAEPVVLVLPPNGDLINWANGQANGAGPVALTDIDIDTASVYLADYLRAFSGLNVAGVLVQLPPGTAVDSGLLELYSPVINVARHYQWAMGMAVDSEAPVSDPEHSLQYTLSPRVEACVTGLVQGDAFWQGEGSDCPTPHFIYARVPPELEPERVLERLAGLRGTLAPTDKTLRAI